MENQTRNQIKDAGTLELVCGEAQFVIISENHTYVQQQENSLQEN